MKDPSGRGERLAARSQALAGESLALIALMMAIMGLGGWLLAGPLGVLVAFGLATASASLLANLGPEAILRMQKARPLRIYDAPRLAGVVRDLARQAGLSDPPRLYLLPSEAPNAFAAGEDEAAALAVSRGLLRGLDQREIRGVLAHELSHLRAGDTRVMRLTASLAETTRSISTVGLLLAFFAALGGAPQPLGAILLFAVAPTAVMLLQFTLMRRREFAADASAVELTGDASGLASALVRLDRWRSRLRYLGYIVGQPPNWLATHPPTQERIERLKELAPRDFMPAAPRRALWHWSF